MRPQGYVKKKNKIDFLYKFYKQVYVRFLSETVKCSSTESDKREKFVTANCNHIFDTGIQYLDAVRL